MAGRRRKIGHRAEGKDDGGGAIDGVVFLITTVVFAFLAVFFGSGASNLNTNRAV
jgi:hypothetical protein